jgi:putative membrane protein
MSLIKEILINGQSWITAFHIIAVVCWFAALLYLPRLFVYHAMSDDEISKERFKVMERKLFRGIATPSMVVTVLLGIALFGIYPSYFISSGWFHVKMALVILLITYHHACLYLMKQFCDDKNTRSHVFYRWFNEIPALMLIGIIVMVVVRPF